MITITEKVAKKLKRELVATCCDLGAEFITIMSDNTKGKEGLAQGIVERCCEYGVGFRLNGGTDDNGQTKFNIRIDNKEVGDEIIDVSGVKIFLDPVSAVHLRDYELDCFDGDDGFFLKVRRGVEIGAKY